MFILKSRSRSFQKIQMAASLSFCFFPDIWKQFALNFIGNQNKKSKRIIFYNCKHFLSIYHAQVYDSFDFGRSMRSQFLAFRPPPDRPRSTRPSTSPYSSRPQRKSTATATATQATDPQVIADIAYVSARQDIQEAHIGELQSQMRQGKGIPIKELQRQDTVEIKPDEAAAVVSPEHETRFKTTGLRKTYDDDAMQIIHHPEAVFKEPKLAQEFPNLNITFKLVHFHISL